MKKSMGSIIITLLALMFILAGCNSESPSPKEEESSKGTEGNSTEVPASGGELRVALNAQPPTLDQLIDPSIVTRDAARVVFEALFTTDSKFQPVPMLAESYETDDKNKVYTFYLREGVKFHNGEEMTAEDVVASMDRWMEMSTVTGAIFEGATFEIEDDYTVVLTLEQPSTLVLDVMASAKQAANIMPREVVETTPAEGLTEYIGTGPFKFVEWKQDQYIHFTKYDDYQAVEGEANGLAGKKEALVDDIYFDIVTDASTRFAGLQTGEYDIVYQIPRDNYAQVKSDENLEAHVDPYGELFYFYNVNAGPASDVKIRQAINTSLDMDSIMKAAYADEDLYWLDSGYMHKNISNWASDAGSEFYNQKDPEKAKELLEASGYDGEEYRIMTTRDYPEFYNAAIVIQDRLKEIGMNVKLDVYDWPTLNEKLRDPSAWDSFVVGSSIVSTPSQLLAISPTFIGGMADDKIMELMKSIETSSDQAEAKQLWDELQGYAWEEYLPVTMLGGSNDVYGATNKVEGFTAFLGPILWNTTIDQ